MIVRTRTIRFNSDRRPSSEYIKLGFEGDNLVERLEFVLPMIGEGQMATLMLGGTYANAVLLTDTEDGKYAVDLTAEMIGTDGKVDGYVRIDSGESVWQTDIMHLITGAIPDVETEIETRYPTAFDIMLSEMAAHKVEMNEAVERAEAAADRAGGSTGGGTSGDGTGGYYGKDGEDGGYYVPSVKGDLLTWTASKSDMPKVASANVRGPQGDPGPAGPQGDTGPQGPQGERGDTGADGATGPAGEDGFSPTVAVTEITGGHRVTITDVNGPKTFEVADGKDGSGGSGGGTGADGEDGGYYQPSVSQNGDLSWSASKTGMPVVETVNIRGPQGEQGIQGEIGPEGPKGDTGETGPEGPQGPKGDDGFSPVVDVATIDGGHSVSVIDSSGTKTFNVMDGAKGDKGDTGETGPEGPQGEQGIQGIQGETGPEGPKGDKGDTGDNGVSPTVSVATIEGGHRVSVTDADGTKNFDVMNGETGPKGEQGEQGETGPEGPQGPQGEQGIQGETGPRGETGADGVSVTHSWDGTTLTVSSASGTTSADLKGEKGDKGDKGDTGETGPEGPQGPAGSDATVTVDSTVTAGGTNPVNSAAVISYAMPITAIVYNETDPGEDTASSYPDGTVVLCP